MTDLRHICCLTAGACSGKLLSRSDLPIKKQDFPDSCRHNGADDLHILDSRYTYGIIVLGSYYTM